MKQRKKWDRSMLTILSRAQESQGWVLVTCKLHSNEPLGPGSANVMCVETYGTCVQYCFAGDVS